jgi:DNA-binding response OmpR family regulator
MTARYILVAEDDAHIRAGLVDALESEGYATEAVADGRAALETYARRKPDLLLLDIMMPLTSGYEVCRTIRRDDTMTPIIMLTAKAEEIDKVVGLELGADDYVTKPFGVRELLARVAAVLRRGRPAAGMTETPSLPAQFVCGDALVDRKRYTVTCRGVPHPVTARELKLLELLVSRAGEVLTREELLNRVWGMTYYGTTRTLDQHIAQLRKKIEVDPEHPAAIQTVHGVGYRYAPPAPGPDHGPHAKTGPRSIRPAGSRA